MRKCWTTGKDQITNAIHHPRGSASSPPAGDCSSQGKLVPRFVFHRPCDTLGLTGKDYNDYYAWCGWNSGTKWGAIWRFEYEENSFTELTPGEDRNFIVSADFSGETVTLYKFDFTLDPPELTDQTLVIKDEYYNEVTGISTIPIPDVDANPTFIQF